ncbi:hopanoid biosynthesis associated RND transporter like protein HpnN [Novosphingobium nitrogenifigens DSM 19370]|uniref:Hopanoid biosynthesis associated RND transporter like protein HpnN n=1 Tax=Novosphingobium nitrogenifigens DSM 19370 TaxID=983920 RepID=F1Z7I0_9SPHN|nr:MMPL family transporter [Novosphingobium nitrogenifigens]EGD59492.1 hopanoid biosynthesis associated RND transporter like protein HpnN [Novosphingobium nitrogenifigens DSM 19370]
MKFAEPVSALVRASVRRPWLVLGIGFLLTVLSLAVDVGRFAMTTDTAELISPSVDWRQREKAFSSEFPQLSDVMLVIIDGQTPELAEDAAARLSARMDADKAHFRSAKRPDAGDFLSREGMLYGSREDVRKATSDLVAAQPLLGPLAADPSLRGVAQSLDTMLDGVTAGQVPLSRIDRPMQALAGSIDQSLAGKPAFFSWQRLLSGGSGRLAAPTRRLVLAQPVLDHTALKPGEAATDAINAAARELQIDAAHGVRLQLTGEVPMADDEFSTLEDNIGVVAMVMVGAMLLTLWFATRSARLVAAIMITIIAGLVVTTAVGLLGIGRFNLISVAFIPLFVGLGVDFGIQICVRFNAEYRVGVAPRQALIDAATALGAPLSLAAAAVFLGFGAFLPTAYVGIAELGVIAGLGMVIALLFSVTVLPALVLLMRPSPAQAETGIAALAPVDALLVRRRRAVLWLFALATVASIAGLPKVVFDFNPLHLRDPAAPSMQALADLTRDPDRTPSTIDVLAANQAEAAALAAKLGKLPEVSQVATLQGFVPEDQDAKLALIQDASMVLDVALNPFDVAPPPSDADMVGALRGTAAKLRTVAATPGQGAGDAAHLATSFDHLASATPAQRAAVNAMLSKPLGVMLDQLRQSLQAQAVTLDTLPDDLRREWVAPDGKARLQVFPSGNTLDNAVLLRFRDAVAKVTPAISGMPVSTQAAAGTIAWAFVQAGVIAFVLVSALLFAVLRNLREVLFTLAPVVLSIFLTLGSCVVIGQPINFANIIAFPLLFGVGVAFHIYFVMAWRAGATALLQSSLARAVLFSAFATGTAFGSLWISHHPGTASMGKILMISLIWTLICALIFEPALLGPPRGEKQAR